MGPKPNYFSTILPVFRYQISTVIDLSFKSVVVFQCENGHGSKVTDPDETSNAAMASSSNSETSGKI